MMTLSATERPTLRSRIVREVVDWAKFLAWAVPVYLVFTTVAFANYRIPSESMVPTLEVGDRVVVSKWSYGYSRHSLPLNLGQLIEPSPRRLFEREPDRGDVVVFVHPLDGKVMIKRLIGLPGDEIALRGGVLFINGLEAPRSQGAPLVRLAHPRELEEATRFEETLPGGARHPVHEFRTPSQFDEFGPYMVPDGHVFMMGDNRDNSLDSRSSQTGPVPLENLIGRAETVYFVTRFCDRSSDVSCPQPRLFRPLSPKQG
jgi:signal peptidase I